jgi:hypothetical protein
MAATDSCDTAVVDDADVLHDPAVLGAARRLEADAVDVRVRTWTTVPDADIDSAVLAEQRRCPSWQSPPAAEKTTSSSWPSLCGTVLVWPCRASPDRISGVRAAARWVSTAQAHLSDSVGRSS